MVILRFKIHSKPDKSDELMAALAEIITPARATAGVVEFDIARVLRDPDSFIATAVYEDGASPRTTGVSSGGAQGHGNAARLAGVAARADDL